MDPDAGEPETCGSGESGSGFGSGSATLERSEPKNLTKSLKPNPMSVNLGLLLQISNFCGNAVKGGR
jgi:hypothetical protein